jgi:hypothetical protein
MGTVGGGWRARTLASASRRCPMPMRGNDVVSNALASAQYQTRSSNPCPGIASRQYGNSEIDWGSAKAKSVLARAFLDMSNQTNFKKVQTKYREGHAGSSGCRRQRVITGRLPHTGRTLPLSTRPRGATSP